MSTQTINVIKCDRCGAKNTTETRVSDVLTDGWGKITFGEVTGFKLDMNSPRDICPNCVTDFDTWWQK